MRFFDLRLDFSIYSISSMFSSSLWAFWSCRDCLLSFLCPSGSSFRFAVTIRIDLYTLWSFKCLLAHLRIKWVSWLSSDLFVHYFFLLYQLGKRLKGISLKVFLVFDVLLIFFLDSTCAHCWSLVHNSIHHLDVFFIDSLKFSLFSDMIQWFWGNFLCWRRIDTIVTDWWPFSFADVK